MGAAYFTLGNKRLNIFGELREGGSNLGNQIVDSQ